MASPIASRQRHTLGAVPQAGLNNRDISMEKYMLAIQAMKNGKDDFDVLGIIDDGELDDML